MEPKWLDWAKRLQAIAQNGLTFVHNPFDQERYEAIRQIAAEMLAEGSNVDFNKVLDLLSRETGYATPKVDTRGVVFQDNALLLVKELSDNGWTLPGGWADPYESPSEAVVREVQEESGFQTRAIKLLAVFDRSKHPHWPPYPYHIYKLFILCELTGGSPKVSKETSDVDFFPEDEIPELSIARVTPAQIRRLFEHHRNPHWPADFD
jgi:ADP-ribose pyrophosphatase YjhB (NUDIX family)